MIRQQLIKLKQNRYAPFTVNSWKDYANLKEEKNLKNHLSARSIIFHLSHFIICELLFLSFFSIIFIYHGPFKKLRDNIVSTSMDTSSYRLFSTWFLSSGEISQILDRTNPVVKNAIENTSNVVIAKSDWVASNTTNIDASPGIAASMQTDTGITLEDISGINYKGKLMVIKDPSRITLGLAPELGKMGATLSSIVKYYNAIGGINAGGFTDTVGAVPEGIVVYNGIVKFSQSGRASYDVIGFNKDDVLVISNSMTLEDIKRNNLRCALSFGPALIINGQPLVNKGGTTLHPRSAIAQRKDGSVLLLVIDGRQTESKGVNLKVLQNILLQHGAYNAANLDGGGSTTMAYGGKIINNPSDITGERMIASAFLVMPLEK